MYQIQNPTQKHIVWFNCRKKGNLISEKRHIGTGSESDDSELIRILCDYIQCRKTNKKTHSAKKKSNPKELIWTIDILGCMSWFPQHCGILPGFRLSRWSRRWRWAWAHPKSVGPIREWLVRARLAAAEPSKRLFFETSISSPFSENQTHLNHTHTHTQSQGLNITKIISPFRMNVQWNHKD